MTIRDDMILAAAAVALDCDATESERQDAIKLVNVLIGNADEFADRTGKRYLSAREAIRSATTRLGREDSRVCSLRVDLAHRAFVYSLLDEALRH